MRRSRRERGQEGKRERERSAARSGGLTPWFAREAGGQLDQRVRDWGCFPPPRRGLGDPPLAAVRNTDDREVQAAPGRTPADPKCPWLVQSPVRTHRVGNARPGTAADPGVGDAPAPGGRRSRRPGFAAARRTTAAAPPGASLRFLGDARWRPKSTSTTTRSARPRKLIVPASATADSVRHHHSRHRQHQGGGGLVGGHVEQPDARSEAGRNSLRHAPGRRAPGSAPAVPPAGIEPGIAWSANTPPP